jgi:hypothetical protein
VNYISKNRSVTYDFLHKTLAHAGDEMIRKTIKATKGLNVKEKQNKSTQRCDSCCVGKLKKANLPRNGSPTGALMDIIEADYQGPFPVEAVDGTTGNFKYMERYSGFVRTVLTNRKTAEVAYKNFTNFKNRLETITGSRLKTLRTDGGKEFKGPFTQSLLDAGISHEESIPYTHTSLGKLERANQTIMRQGRAGHVFSKLPKEYYGESQLFATHVFNVTVHGSETITPHEKLYGTVPDISNLYPFGTICYTAVPSEKRNKNDNTGERCRLIGFGGETRKGWKLLRESDRSIVFSRDVLFDINTNPEALPNTAAFDDDDDENSLFYNDLLPFAKSSEAYVGDYSESEAESEYITASDNVASDAETDEIIPSDNSSVPSEYDGSSDSYRPSSGEEYDSDLVEEFTQRAPWYAAYAVAQTRDEWNDSLAFDPDLLYDCCMADIHELPRNYKEAVTSPEKEGWLQAIATEMAAHKVCNTWENAELPPGRKAIGCRWVFTKKFDRHGKLLRYKARLVAKGFSQKHGVDYNETFAPVAKLKSLRMLFAISAVNGLKLHRMDVNTAFLNGIVQ